MTETTLSDTLRRASLVGLLAAAGLVIACTGAPAPADATEPLEPPRLMTVTGEGSVSAAPDRALIGFGVTSEADTAQAALAANTTNMTQVFDTLTEAGVEERDIQTSRFAIHPRYRSYPRGESGPPVIIGYSVSNMVSVTVRDLDALGGILDAVVRSGANQFDALSFHISEPQPLLDDARRLAVADARRKAELLTEAAGVTLGRVRSISESGGTMPPPMPMLARARMEDASVPIAAGENALRSTVSITYELQ